MNYELMIAPLANAGRCGAEAAKARPFAITRAYGVWDTTGASHKCGMHCARGRLRAGTLCGGMDAG